MKVVRGRLKVSTVVASRRRDGLDYHVVEFGEGVAEPVFCLPDRLVDRRQGCVGDDDSCRSLEPVSNPDWRYSPWHRLSARSGPPR